MSLNVSDIIQVMGILVALLIGLISIIISVISLRQNSKTIKESNKAQIVIFPYKIYGDIVPRIRIQNFGATTGLIKDIKIIPELPKEDIAVNPFESLKNMSLAPNQSLTTIFSKESMAKPPLDEFDVIITYTTLGELVKDTQHINYNFLNITYETSSISKDANTSLDKINLSIQGLQQK